MTDPEDVVELRPLLFSIAYRMLGSVADAEDIVQAAYLRYLDYGKHGQEADSPRALLTPSPRDWRSISSVRRACGARRTSGPGCRSRCSPPPSPMLRRR